jgi:uncharacterized protein
MVSLRLVIDTNVLVSAALKSDGLERTTLLLAMTKPARLYVSRPILDEYRRVLSRPELKIRKGLRRLRAARDPDDDKFLECADRARADYLVTGNLRHFPRYWKATKIVTAREFLELVSPHLIG